MNAPDAKSSFQTEGQEREITAPGEQLVVLATREAKRGQRPALLGAIDALLHRARHAAGFISVDVLAPFDEPSVLVHYETWATKAAHDAFDSGPVHDEFAEKIGPLVSHHNIPIHWKRVARYERAASALPTPMTDLEPRLAFSERALESDLGIFRMLAHAESAFVPLMNLKDVLSKHVHGDAGPPSSHRAERAVSSGS